MVALLHKSTASLLDCHRCICRWFEICWRLISTRKHRKQGRSAAFAMRGRFRNSLTGNTSAKYVMNGGTSSFHPPVCSSNFGIRHFKHCYILLEASPSSQTVLYLRVETKDIFIRLSTAQRNFLQSGITNPRRTLQQPATSNLLTSVQHIFRVALLERR